MFNLISKNKSSRTAASIAGAFGKSFETLESRQLMSASFLFDGASGVLTVTNTGASPALHATRSSDGTQLRIKTSSNNNGNYDQTIHSRALNGLNKVVFNGDQTWSNKLTVDGSINKPFVFIGGSAADHFVGGSGNDELFGNGGNDYLYGGPGHDKLHGGANDDTLAGGSGHDYMDGGHGTDTVTYFDRTLPVKIFATALYASGSVSEGEQDRIEATCENIIGGAGNDTIYGNSHADAIIRGGAGNDLIYGTGRHDRIYGEAGNDTISGAGGSDYLVGGSGTDTIKAKDGTGGNDTIFGGNAPDSPLISYGTDVIEFDKTPRYITILGTRVLIGYATDVVNYAKAPVVK